MGDVQQSDSRYTRKHYSEAYACGINMRYMSAQGAGMMSRCGGLREEKARIQAVLL